MTSKRIKKIFSDTAYVRMGGSEQELKAANYIVNLLKERNLNARLESFEVPMATIKTATLTVDGKQIECKGYFNCGNANITAPLYYLTADDEYSGAVIFAIPQ